MRAILSSCLWLVAAAGLANAQRVGDTPTARVTDTLPAAVIDVRVLPWYDAAWTHRIRITVRPELVQAAHEPGMVFDCGMLFADPVYDPFWEHLTADGGDLRVTLADGVSETARGVREFDPTQRTGVVYFRALNLATNEPTDYYLYFGNGAAADYAGDAPLGMNAVWDAGHVAVFTMGDQVSVAGDFSDDFEVWQGWEDYQNGTVSQSDEQAYAGQYALKKEGNNDPHGGRKAMGIQVVRDYTAQGWFYRPSPWAGGAADRISISTRDGDGYGFYVNESALAIERRNAGVGTVITSRASNQRPINQWYRWVFEAFNNNTFRLRYYDHDAQLIESLTSAADTTHAGPFTHLMIHGGWPCYLDEVSVSSTAVVRRIRDETGWLHDIAKTGADLPSEAGGIVGTAQDFNGVNQYLQIPDSDLINTGGPYSDRTVMLWFYARDSLSRQMLFEEGGGTRGFNIYLLNGRVYVGGWNRAEYNWAGTWLHAGVAAEQWHHIVLKLENGGDAVLPDRFFGYLDGEEFDRGPGGRVYGHSGDICLGRSGNTYYHDIGETSVAGEYFNGLIDEVAILNSALEADAIRTIHAAQRHPASFWDLGTVEQ